MTDFLRAETARSPRALFLRLARTLRDLLRLRLCFNLSVLDFFSRFLLVIESAGGYLMSQLPSKSVCSFDHYRLNSVRSLYSLNSNSSLENLVTKPITKAPPLSPYSLLIGTLFMRAHFY